MQRYTRSLREKCAYSDFFWSVFSRIQNEFGEIRNVYFHVVAIIVAWYSPLVVQTTTQIIAAMSITIHSDFFKSREDISKPRRELSSAVNFLFCIFSSSSNREVGKGVFEKVFYVHYMIFSCMVITGKWNNHLSIIYTPFTETCLWTVDLTSLVFIRYFYGVDVDE